MNNETTPNQPEDMTGYETGLSRGDYMAKVLGHSDENTIAAYRAEGHSVDDAGTHAIDCKGCGREAQPTIDGPTEEDKQANQKQRTLEDMLNQFFGPDATARMSMGIVYGQPQPDPGTELFQTLDLSALDLKVIYYAIAINDVASQVTDRHAGQDAMRNGIELSAELRKTFEAAGVDKHTYLVNLGERLFKAIEMIARDPARYTFNVNPF